ncbi:MAG: type IV secretion system protein, partial [gamma proteobacterium symbiont of Lucinoma myriamae]|nr:type IV secretion system protein [gamma proteobacterium symbiont of Lucinoma myriamae]
MVVLDTSCYQYGVYVWFYDPKKSADIGEFFAEFIRFTLFVGFFWWLLINGTNFSVDLISSFQTMGSSISGYGKDLKPTGIVDIGFDTFFSIVAHSSWSIKSFVAIV